MRSLIWFYCFIPPQLGRAQGPYICAFVFLCLIYSWSCFSAVGSKGLGFYRSRIGDFHRHDSCNSNNGGMGLCEISGLLGRFLESFLHCLSHRCPGLEGTLEGVWNCSCQVFSPATVAYNILEVLLESLASLFGLVKGVEDVVCD